MSSEITRWNLARMLIKGFLLVVIALIIFCNLDGRLYAATVVVPGDYATIQKAVNVVESDADPGVVIINSNGTFDESVYITESVTIMAGNGFTPTIEKTTGALPPIRIYANGNSDTTITLEGLNINAYGGSGPPDSDVSEDVIIANDSSSNTLDVSLNKLRITGDQIQSAVSIASAVMAGNITLTISDSFIQVIGKPAGSPVCLRLDPDDYDLNVILENNTFRFAVAGGVSIESGKDGRTVSVTADSNIFEGFIVDTTDPFKAVNISGSGTTGSESSATTTTLKNNFFISASTAVSVLGSKTHTHSLYLYNNTIFSCRSHGIYLSASDTSVINATIINNIVAGTYQAVCGSGYGITLYQGSSATVNLDNDYNLLFDNVAGDYSGVTAGGHSLHADPGFANADSLNLRLRPSSAAIDAGICGKWISIPPSLYFYSRIAPLDDFEGDPRPAGFALLGCDIGADEFNPGRAAIPAVNFLLSD
ncbi:MAG: right-handed parallel beta-helix repeat-containing protein [Deltaproteobacteria bacterium]|nr:right-handed parallel beta-helix repeat-containing protein [Deltaproteobacteria bacterium]